MKYDVIIVGGGTAGCAAAYTAGKLGLNTLLVEKNTFLGGTITGSLVIPAMKTSENAINTDFFEILYTKLSSLGGAITYTDGNKGWFNPELTKIALDSMMLEANVNILMCSKISEITKMLSGYSVTIDSDNKNSFLQTLSDPIETKYVIDATGDGKICELLNIEKINFENETQPVNLRFILSGVNSKKFANWLLDYDKDRSVTTACEIDGNVYLSTAYTWDTDKEWALKPLFKKAVDDGVLKYADTNYFQIFSVAGTQDSIAFNCPRLLEQSENFYIDGRAAILRITEFCKKYLPGFEKAYISKIADTIGVRVSTRIKGRYVYTKSDLVSGKTFDNPVVISNYPIDIHSDKKNTSKLEKVYQEYQLPIEALTVDDNLFVAGRCLSADFEAQAALRIIPSCFSMGEGVAKYIYKLIYS